MKPLWAAPAWATIGVLLGLTLACNGGGAPATPTPIADVCQPNPDPATPDVLVIDTPQPGDTVSSPITVSGQVAAFEATFQVALFDASGNLIAELVGMSAEGQTLAPFSEQLPFPSTASGPACLWVYEASARDGSPIHVGQVPVLLSP